MPTAPRLIAAVLLAILAYITSVQIVPLLPEGTDMGYFFPLNMALGVFVGWFYFNRRIGRGLVSGLNNGLTGTALLLGLGLLAQGSNEMFRLAMRHHFDGPFDALGAIFTISVDYLFLISVPAVLGTLAIGGCVVGVLTESASKRWK